jgi:hypothetical protein
MTVRAFATRNRERVRQRTTPRNLLGRDGRARSKACRSGWYRGLWHRRLASVLETVTSTRWSHRCAPNHLIYRGLEGRVRVPGDQRLLSARGDLARRDLSFHASVSRDRALGAVGCLARAPRPRDRRRTDAMWRWVPFGRRPGAPRVLAAPADVRDERDRQRRVRPQAAVRQKIAVPAPWDPCTRTDRRRSMRPRSVRSDRSGKQLSEATRTRWCGRAAGGSSSWVSSHWTGRRPCGHVRESTGDAHDQRCRGARRPLRLGSIGLRSGRGRVRRIVG